MNKFRLSCVALFALLSHPQSSAATWDGGSPTVTLWTTDSNWTGDVAPVAGEALVFPSGVASGKRSAFNSFAAGTAFPSVLIQDIGYTLNGNQWNVGQFIELSTGTGLSTINTPVTLASSTVEFRSGGARAALVFGGAVELAGKTLDLKGFGRIQFNANVTDSGSGTILKSTGGTAEFATGTTVAASSGIQVNAGQVIMNGTCANTIAVASGAALAGSGSAAGVSVSGRFSPGSLYGTFTSSGGFNFSSTSTFAVDLNNTGATADMAVSGNSVTIASGAQLEVNLPSPMQLVPGQAFTILRKTPAGAISGQFANAANGSYITVGKVTFIVNYAGESGNDLVLTVHDIAPTGVTRTWDGGGTNDLWSTVQNWSDDTFVESGDSLVFPAGTPRPNPVNDLIQDLPLTNLTISSGTYVFSGNRFTWMGNMTLNHTDADLRFDLPIAIGTQFNSGGGQVLLSGPRAFTLKGGLTESPYSSPALYLRNEATGGGGIKIESAFYLPNTTIYSVNASATPIEWKASSNSQGEGVYFLGGNQLLTGPNSILLDGASIGHIDPAGSFGTLPPTVVTLGSSALWQITYMQIGAGSLLTSTPGQTSQIGTSYIGFMGTGGSISPGAGGILQVGFTQILTSANVQATVNASLIPTQSSFGFDLGSGSLCQVKEISASSSTTGYLESGGRLGLGPVSNVTSFAVQEDSVLELTASNSGSAAMDVTLGTTGSFGSPGHLTGRGRCKNLTSLRTGSSVSPGTPSSPYGVITCNNFASSSLAVRYDVAGLVPGVSADQIEVLQQANFDSSSLLPEITFVNGYAPQPMEEIVIYKLAPGAFADGLGFGAIQITVFGQRFLFYSAGGDGNDVALQKRAIAVPTTGAEAGLPPAALVQNQSTGQWSFQQQARGIDGMIYVIEASTNLMSWAEVTRVQASAFSFPPVDMGPATFSFQVSVDLQTQKKRFFRIRPL